ncbi:MAG: hypothetical protein DRI90_17620 [Deltaproteobacteria bacterium]|nr:MAG: hypothetical protein DRI90_17620 [Deltaproteobacteria bacterium]
MVSGDANLLYCAAMSHRHTIALLFSIGLVASAVGCEPKELDKCLKNKDCGASMSCIDSRCLGKEASSKHCKNSAKFAANCERNGACSWVEGQCEPASKEDCAGSSGCKKDARCTFDGKDRCVLKSGDDCKSSEFCTKLQRCAYDEKSKQCLPGNDAQCKAQSDCKAGAACTFDDKAPSNCVPSESDCKESVMCKNLGLCALGPEKKKCVPGSEEDCKLTIDCKAGKICAWDAEAKKCVKEE